MVNKIHEFSSLEISSEEYKISEPIPTWLCSKNFKRNPDGEENLRKITNFSWFIYWKDRKSMYLSGQWVWIQHTKRNMGKSLFFFNVHFLLNKQSKTREGAFSCWTTKYACGTAEKIGTFHRLPADDGRKSKHRQLQKKTWKVPAGTLNPVGPTYHENS